MPDMELHGQAMLDYLNGDAAALCILRRDDGIAYPPIYAKQFFYPDGLPELDKIAVENCAGRVLDIGAGAGSHSLAIQERGLDVTSIDISAKAVRVMSERGCKDAKVGDVFDSYSELFDTIFIILNIGIVQNLNGLARFLKHLETLLTDGGRLITDSIDPRNSEDKSYRKYTQDKITKGCYLGERTLRFEYKDQASEWFEWMHIDPETLEQYVDEAGYSMKHIGNDGKRYLVSIAKR
ncbi:MAG: methyltransferase domain-containing protein [Acidobacteria bacterium]|jgi:cyclopropane fatty-acyl-phospholipid synthase-like methyltransferase|nr:methyltransferase domain-containing protein [Acidobacteriota bacterium]MBA4185526.1 methyltransferase domain-containing protein [Acidobacteriota bacterium]